MNKIKKILSENNDAYIVISDIRFPNEINYIKMMGGISIRVKNPRTYNTNNEDVHISEKLIDELDVDLEILNDKGINNLYDSVDDLIENNKLVSKCNYEAIKTIN